MNQATTAHATKNETIKPMKRTIQSWPLMWAGEKAWVPAALGLIAFFSANSVATSIVGMERKNENSSAADRDIPATCPAAMVDIDRDVPGKTAERIWQAPIQIECSKPICSIRSM